MYQKIFANGVWVNYGWEIFDYITDARSSSLGNANIAYHYEMPGSSLINPFIISNPKNYISITHQSRYAGLFNNDLIGFQINKFKTPIQINIFYQGIGQIPDTRNMLLDWGVDGQFVTNDLGEGNGILDEGERLDKNKLAFFTQKQFGLYSAFRRKILNRNFGIAFKLLGQNLNKHSALGIGLDIGFIKKIGNLDIAGTVKNLPASGLIWDDGIIEGSIAKFSIGGHYHKTIDKLPISFHLISKLCIDDNFNSNGITFLNPELNNLIKIIHRSYGLETVYNNRLFIRIGRDIFYRSTGGIGLYWNGFVLDYAFLGSFGTGLEGNHHLISINIEFEYFLSFISQL